MELKHKICIVVVAYNTPQFLIPQVECIRKYCTDPYDIFIVDNSSDLGAAENIKYHSERLGCLYVKTDASSLNGSDSHSFAANLAYQMIKNQAEWIAYFDHDLFPLKQFSLPEILGDKVIAGIGQIKNDKKYLWQGCLIINNTLVDKDLMDFSPNSEYRLDTGGNLYKLIEKVSEERCIFFDERYVQNPNFTKSFYNFYTLINQEMFLHCVNGSGWNPSEGQEERINSLMNTLKEKAGI
jgi:glycosyltransferase involved in cell wall biosynthesis